MQHCIYKYPEAKHMPFFHRGPTRADGAGGGGTGDSQRPSTCLSFIGVPPEQTGAGGW